MANRQLCERVALGGSVSLVIILSRFADMSKKNSLISPQEAELAALRAKASKRREYLDLLELELANTRAAIQEFTDLYNRRIGPLEAEQQRLQRLLEDLQADQAPPSNDWRGVRREAGRQQGNGENGHSQQDKPFKKKPLPAAQQDPDYERKVRDLFRKLAKQYHPDVAKDDEQRKHHETLMSEINQAYSAKNLEALRKLAEHKAEPAGEAASTPAAELARLIVELRQLEMMIFDIEQTIRELDLSPAMQMRSELKADQEDGRDSLSELELQFRNRISDLEEQLIAMGAETEAQKK